MIRIEMAWFVMVVAVVFLVCVVSGDSEDYDPCKAGMFIKHRSSSFTECYDMIAKGYPCVLSSSFNKV
jgi:hypothetical protein